MATSSTVRIASMLVAGVKRRNCSSVPQSDRVRYVRRVAAKEHLGMSFALGEATPVSFLDQRQTLLEQLKHFPNTCSQL